MLGRGCVCLGYMVLSNPTPDFTLARQSTTPNLWPFLRVVLGLPKNWAKSTESSPKPLPTPEFPYGYHLAVPSHICCDEPVHCSIKSTVSVRARPWRCTFPCCCLAAQCVWLFAIPCTAARQASLSFTVSQSLLKLMFIESVMPSVGFDKRIMACIYHDSGGYRPVVIQTSFTALNIPWAPTIHPPCLYTLATIDLFPVSVAEAFPKCHRVRSIQYVVFSAWLLSLCSMH